MIPLSSKPKEGSQIDALLSTNYIASARATAKERHQNISLKSQWDYPTLESPYEKELIMNTRIES